MRLQAGDALVCRLFPIFPRQRDCQRMRNADDWDITRDPCEGLDIEIAAYEPPLIWTADHVMSRMITAWEVFSRIKGRVGPAGYGSGWPQYVYEYEDLLAQESPAPGETQSQAEQRRIGERAPIQLPPSAREYSMMEEAFNWPVTYLRGRVSVALVKWSYERFRERRDQSNLIFKAYDEAELIAGRLVSDRCLVR
jgi:hypothetical protein